MSKVIESQKDLAAGDLKLWNVVCTRSDLSVICGEYEDLVRKQHEVMGLPGAYQGALRHEVIVWQLLEVLFANIVFIHEIG